MNMERLGYMNLLLPVSINIQKLTSELNALTTELTLTLIKDKDPIDEKGEVAKLIGEIEHKTLEILENI